MLRMGYILPVLEFIPLALSGVSEMYLTKLAVHAKRDQDKKLKYSSR